MAQTSWHKYELFFTPQAVLDHINGPESFSRQDIRNALKTTYPDTTALAGKDLLYCVDHSLVDPTIYGETIRVCVAVLNEIRATIHEFLLESGAKSVIRLKQSPQATWNFPKDTRKVRGWAQRVDNPEELVKPHFGVSNMVPRIWSFRNPNIAKEQIYALANPGTHVSVTKYRPDLAPITYYMHVPIKLMITVYLSAMQSNYAMHKRKWVHNDIKPANIGTTLDQVLLFDLEACMPSRRFASSTHTPDYDEKSYYGGNIPLDPAHDVFSWAITFMEIVAGCDLNTFVKPNKDKYTETELNTLIDYELQRRELGMFIPTIKNMVTKDRKKRWSLKKALNKIWNALKRSPKLTDSNVSPLDLKKKFALPSSTP